VACTVTQHKNDLKTLVSRRSKLQTDINLVLLSASRTIVELRPPLLKLKQAIVCSHQKQQDRLLSRKESYEKLKLVKLKLGGAFK